MQGRDLTLDDLENVGILLLAMHEESQVSHYPPAIERGLYILAKLIVDPEVLTYGAFNSEDKLVGAFIAEVTTHPFIEYNVAKDLFFYVDKSARGSRAALILLNAWDNWFKEISADMSMIEISAGVNNDVVDRMLSKRGYERAGTLMFKESV